VTDLFPVQASARNLNIYLVECPSKFRREIDSSHMWLQFIRSFKHCYTVEPFRVTWSHDVTEYPYCELGTLV